MNKLLFYYLCIACCLASCSNKREEAKITNNNLVEIQKEEIHFPPSEVLQLKSYYLSSPIQTDSTHILVGYNYKEHALDCINLSNKSISQIPLQSDGPNSIMRLTGIFAYEKDSIWVSDDSESVFLINSEGSVKKRINVKNYLKDKEELIINTNHAMSTVRLYYNATHQSLLCTVKDRSVLPACFKVKEIFLDKDKETKTINLSSSIVEPDVSKGYANMSEPNVNFHDNYILYNYPIESHIYRINLTTRTSETYNADSDYTQNMAKKCKSKDYTEWQRHGFENPHFFDIMYLSHYGVYARLHMDAINFKEDENLDIVSRKRNFYLCFFDENFNKINEIKLPSKTINPYTGWNYTHTGVLFFIDPITNQDISEDLDVSIYYPVI